VSANRGFYELCSKVSEALSGRLAKGGIATSIVKASARILSVLVIMIAARTLGAEEYGTFAFALTVAALMAIPAQLGMPHFLTREVSVYLVKNEYGSFKGLLRRSGQLVLAVSVGVALLGLIIVHHLPENHGAIDRNVMQLALLLIPFLSLASIRVGALRGLGAVVQAQLPEELVRPLAFLLLLIGTYYLAVDVELDATTAMWFQIVASAVGFLFGAWLLMRSYPPAAKSALPATETRRWVMGAMPFTLIATGNLIALQADVLVLGLLSTAEDVGVYRVVWLAASLVIFGVNVVDAVVAPHIARLFESGDKERLQRIVTLSARWALAMSIPFVLVFAIFGEDLLRLMFGEEFARGYTALLILTLGQVFNASRGVVGQLLMMTGNAWYATTGIGISAVANVILNVALVPKFGIEGAAMATAGSMVIWGVLMMYWAKVRTGIVSHALYFGKSAR
jgi:O-antigen/teichoic acid export membrane protein